MIKKILIFFIIFTSGLSAQIYNIKGVTNPYFRIGMKNPPIKHSISKERYYYLPDSTNSLTDTMWIQSMPAMVYPQWFGANNSTSIQAAVNSISKGTVNLGSSIYNSTATITLKDSVNIIGDNFTIWTADSIINIFTAVNKKDILISGGKLIGGRRKRYAPNEGSQRKKGNGFLLDNTKFVTIDNMRIYDFQNGVMDDNSNYLTIKNSYFQMRQDSAFTCLQLRGTSYSTFANNNFIDSLHTTSGSTINAIYSYSAEQRCVDNVINFNYFYGFGNNLPASDIGYEQTICVGWDNGKYINNYSDYGWRALDIATYPGGNDRERGFLVQGNTFRRAKQWAVRFNGNTFGTDPTQVLKYNEVIVNYFDSCRGGVLLFDSTKFTNVSLNKFRRTYGKATPYAYDGAITGHDNLSFINIHKNIIDSSGYSGIVLKNVRDSEITENVVTWSGMQGNDDYGNGIELYSPNAGQRKNKRNKISGNSILHNRTYGIYTNENEGLIFTENKCFYNDRGLQVNYGILIASSNYAAIINNFSVGHDYAIRLDSLIGQYVQFNTFYSNATNNNYYTTTGVAAYGKYNAGTDSVKGGYAKFTGYDATGTYALKYGTTPATTGEIRLGWGNAVVFRDSANTANHYAVSTGVYGNAGQLTVGSNTVGTKVRIYPGSSNAFDILYNGDVEGRGNFHIIDAAKAIKMAGAVLLDKRALNLLTSGSAPEITMDGVQVLAPTALNIGTSVLNQIGLKINNVYVVQGRQAAVSDVVGTADLTYDQGEVDMLNSLRTQLNLLLSRDRAHGLIAP